MEIIDVIPQYLLRIDLLAQRGSGPEITHIFLSPIYPMSQSRGLLPVVLATTIGIGTGLYIFGPAFKEDKERKEREQ